ncbi:MlaE family ABC transporter permease [Methylacidimicrobium tartarophylax]|uniref:Putative phospholipid ABC transporter permease protein MlaE n=1 Tax=Methylacidimicrobium tartarophylax TaxID=1041768 RepID=A0A5E6M8F8_9BACT|nr:ABC transporter permease [Methylacidimicrobium tartarophylax]VVM05217.1 putative phospholipid ABC transporter permease protein MlaE [Methylacidimicrobium tartarophylax]
MKLLRHFVSGWSGLLEAAGAIYFLFADVVYSIFRYRLRWELFLDQIIRIGMRSQGVVLITGAFTGAVFAAQTQFRFGKFGMSSATGPVVAISMLRELGPVLCALMISGRVGSAMAAELSTMRVTEQIDALRALAVDPTQYLIVPRFLGLLVSMPFLVALTSGTGILLGYLVSTLLLGVDPTFYWDNTVKFTGAKDIWMGEIKALFFAAIIVLISCHRGLRCRLSAEGVGIAATEAMVFSSITVLISNFFFSFLMNLILAS